MAGTIEQADRQNLNESRYWAKEANYQSPLGLKCVKLRKKAIATLDTAELRFLIHQNVGTQHVLPKALNLLRQNPLDEAGHYPGALLEAVAALPTLYWEANPAHLAPTLEVAV